MAARSDVNRAPGKDLCPKCRKPMRFLLRKTGGRKFKCLECDGDDPLRSPDIAKLLSGELRPLEHD
jgi:hypothetical protein